MWERRNLWLLAGRDIEIIGVFHSVFLSANSHELSVIESPWNSKNIFIRRRTFAAGGIATSKICGACAVDAEFDFSGMNFCELDYIVKYFAVSFFRRFLQMLYGVFNFSFDWVFAFPVPFLSFLAQNLAGDFCKPLVK